MPKKKKNVAPTFTDEELAKFEYDTNDAVLAFHSEYLYEAKITDRKINKRKSGNPPEYKVHYQGWNKRHDEWVGNDRILPKNSSNLLIKKQLDEQMKQELEREKNEKNGINQSKKRKSKSDDAPSAKRRKLNSNGSNSNNVSGNEKSPSNEIEGDKDDRGRSRQRKTRKHDRNKKSKKKDKNESESESDSDESSSDDDSDNNNNNNNNNNNESHSKSISRSQTNSSNESNSDSDNSNDSDDSDNNSKKRRKKKKSRRHRRKHKSKKSKSSKSRDKKSKDKSNKDSNSSNGNKDNNHNNGGNNDITMGQVPNGKMHITMNNSMHVVVTPQGQHGHNQHGGPALPPPPPHNQHNSQMVPPPQAPNMYNNGNNGINSNNTNHYGYSGMTNNNNNNSNINNNNNNNNNNINNNANLHNSHSGLGNNNNNNNNSNNNINNPTNNNNVNTNNNPNGNNNNNNNNNIGMPCPPPPPPQLSMTMNVHNLQVTAIPGMNTMNTMNAMPVALSTTHNNNGVNNISQMNLQGPPMINGHPATMMSQPQQAPNIHPMNNGINQGVNQINYANVSNNVNVNVGPNNNNNNNHHSNNNNNNINDSNKGQTLSSNKLNITLPKAIKKKLIYDWEQITKDNKLMNLPRSSGERVIDILKDYEDYANNETISNGNGNIDDNTTQKDVIAEIVRGLRDYFDQALEVTLLYKFERPQLSDLMNERKDLAMSQIYGVEHLCRLFVKLPQLLAPDELDGDTRRVLTEKIDDIIKFLLINENKYFTKSYMDADDNYKQRVRNLEAQMNTRPPAHRMNT